jgi:hypothetical protein
MICLARKSCFYEATQTNRGREMVWWQRLLCGGAGGLAAVCVKFISTTLPHIEEAGANSQIADLLLAYYFTTPILIFLGGTVAVLMQETQAIKLFIIGISAPALVTTWGGGGGGGKPARGQQTPAAIEHKVGINPLFFIGSAQAQTDSENKEPDRRSVIERLGNGLQIYFGYEKIEKRYWVVAGSFKSREDAGKMADDLNKDIEASKAEHRAFVGLVNEKTQYYPVIVGPHVPFDEAEEIRKAILELPTLQALIKASPKNTPYLSPG